MRSKEKRFQDVTTKTRTDKQTNIWQTILFETEYFLFEKKTSYGQIRTQGLCRPKHIRYLQAKLVNWPWMHRNWNSSWIMIQLILLNKLLTRKKFILRLDIASVKRKMAVLFNVASIQKICKSCVIMLFCTSNYLCNLSNFIRSKAKQYSCKTANNSRKVNYPKYDNFLRLLNTFSVLHHCWTPPPPIT